MCVSEDSLCVCMYMCVRRLLALLIVHRWVFTIGKGELERKWWTPCVGDENVPEGALDQAPFTGICVVVLEIEGERKLRLYSHVCSLTAFVPEWVCLHVTPSDSCRVCVSVNEFVCVSLAGSCGLLFVSDQRGYNLARLQESSLTQPSRVNTAVEGCCAPLFVPLGMITHQPPDEYLVKVEEEWGLHSCQNSSLHTQPSSHSCRLLV